MSKPHSMTARLSVDAMRAIKLHQSLHPNLSSMNDAINDILERHGNHELQSNSGGSVVDSGELISLLSEQSSTLSQLTIVTLRNFGLNIEIAQSTDPELAQRGEARARSLLKQMKEN